MTQQHTPGPWEAHKTPGHGDHWITTPHRKVGYKLAYVSPDSQIGAARDGEAEANARLIVAASDMLTALEHMTGVQRFLPDMCDWCANAVAVIARAKGEQP